MMYASIIYTLLLVYLNWERGEKYQPSNSVRSGRIATCKRINALQVRSQVSLCPCRRLWGTTTHPKSSSTTMNHPESHLYSQHDDGENDNSGMVWWPACVLLVSAIKAENTTCLCVLCFMFPPV